jgi:hypothetical protein
MSSNSELHARWRLAQDIADEAGRITLEHFQQEGLQVAPRNNISAVESARLSPTMRFSARSSAKRRASPPGDGFSIRSTAPSRSFAACRCTAR